MNATDRLRQMIRDGRLIVRMPRVRFTLEDTEATTEADAAAYAASRVESGTFRLWDFPMPKNLAACHAAVQAENAKRYQRACLGVGAWLTGMRL